VTSLEFAYAAMLDVSCIISGGSHDQCLVSHALSDVHHMIQVRCDQVKGIQMIISYSTCTIYHK